MDVVSGPPRGDTDLEFVGEGLFHLSAETPALENKHGEGFLEGLLDVAELGGGEGWGEAG